MAVRVRYFANLRETLGRSEDSIEHHDGLTVAEVRTSLLGDCSDGQQLLSAVNMEYAGNETPVKDGDEVAFFPRVSGG